MATFNILKAGKIVATVGADSPSHALKVAKREWSLTGAIKAVAQKKRPKRAKKNTAAKKKTAPKKRSASKKTKAVSGIARSNSAKKSKPVRTKTKGKKKPVKRNSGQAAKAIERFEYFHGKEPEVIHDIVQERDEQTVQSGIGYLIALEVWDGTGDLHLIKGFKKALLTQDLDGTQLFIVGGDQSVDVEDFGIEAPHRYEVLGAVKSVKYDTEKTHLSAKDGGKGHYLHQFGDDGGILPILIYDTSNEQMMFAGGSYSIPSQGIAD